MKKKILFLLVIGLMLIGCSKKNKEVEKTKIEENEISQKLFSFKSVEKKETYQGLSNMGIDYTFPNLNNSWGEWKILGNDNKVLTNTQDTSKIFIIRNTDVKDVTSEDFLKKLNGKDIRSYLEQQIATHIGVTEEAEGELHYIEDIKYYDTSGRVKHDQKQYLYRVVYFQSKLFQPSVFRKYVPTALFVLYEDGKKTNEVLGMIETFKNNLTYQN